MSNDLPFIAAKPSAVDDDAIVGACRCGARWVGGKLCHCATCHATFGSIGGFDFHRRGRVGETRCVAPGDIGMMLDSLGAWRMPNDNPQWFKRGDQ